MAWNLNSLSVHNFAKLTQLKTYNLIYKHDFICLSETYLYSATPKNLLEVKGYNLVWVDHLKNIKRGGVCIYYKESFPVRAINFPYFNEALLLEMSHNNKKVIVSVIYGSFSQNNDVFDLCLSNFENLITETKNHKPYFSVITGDFNARSSFWWFNNISTTEGTKLFAQISSDVFQQIIKERTHIQKIVLLVLILFSRIRQTYPLIMKFIHLYIQIVIIKLFMQVLIFKIVVVQCTSINPGVFNSRKLCSLIFSNDKILKLIRSLNLHNAHGYDDISIRMIKMCDKSLVKNVL